MRTKKPTFTLITNPFNVDAKIIHQDACGGYSKQFRAQIEVECNKLDQHGFVIEVNSIVESVQNFFATATYKASCEELAACVIKIILDLGGDKLTRVQAEVFGANGRIRAEWRKGDEMPHLPLCVTNNVAH